MPCNSYRIREGDGEYIRNSSHYRINGQWLGGIASENVVLCRHRRRAELAVYDGEQQPKLLALPACLWAINECFVLLGPSSVVQSCLGLNSEAEG